jgi:hypothetical protein
MVGLTACKLGVEDVALQTIAGRRAAAETAKDAGASPELGATPSTDEVSGIVVLSGDASVFAEAGTEGESDSQASLEAAGSGGHDDRSAAGEPARDAASAGD